MFKKLLSMLLCLVVLLSGAESIVYGAQAQVEPQALTHATEEHDYITIASLLKKYKVEEDWLVEQLEKGYSLFQINKTLSETGNNKSKYENKIKSESKVQVVQSDVTGLQPQIQNNMTQAQITAAGEYDEKALTQMPIHQASSDYAVSYGTEVVSASTGDVGIFATDFELPGAIPFQLDRVYEASMANNDIAVASSNGSYINKAGIRREERDTGLGRGWRWDLPSIQDRNEGKYLYYPGIGTYKLSAGLQLEGYPWENIQLSNDSTVNVGGRDSQIKLSILNGLQYYFDPTGHLLLIQDDYNNRVEFQYTDNQSGGTLLSTIHNSDGNELNFAYSTDKVVVTQKGTERKLEYILIPEGDYQNLRSVTDAVGLKMRYIYVDRETKFNFIADNVNDSTSQGVEHQALLYQIISPYSGLTELTYTTHIKNMGDYATRQIYKLASRKDIYSTALGPVVSNEVKLSYTNEEMNQHIDSFNTATTIQSGGTQDKYQFHHNKNGETHPETIQLSQLQSQGDTTEVKQEYIYDDTRAGANVPIQINESYVQDGQSSEILTSKYQYDDKGMLEKESKSTGQESIVHYQNSVAPYYWSLPSTITTKIKDGQSRVETYQYNNQGSTVQSAVKENTIDGKLLAQTDIQYDLFGNPNVTTIKDTTNNIVSSQSYESPYGRHLLTKETMVVSAVDNTLSTVSKQYSYTATGDLQSTTDEAGKVTGFTYDPIGRIKQVSYHDSTKQSVRYDDDLYSVTITAPDGVVTTNKFNPLGWLAQEVQDKSVYQYFYNKEGNVEQLIDAEQNSTLYSYDAFNRLKRTIYADLTEDTVDYDLAHLTTTYTDASGNKQREQSDLLGQITLQEENNNGSFIPLAKWTYDLDGNVLTNQDGNGQITTSTYDALGRLISVTDPEQRTTGYTFSQAGNLTGISLPDKTSISKQYDEQGRLTRQVNQEYQAASYYYDAHSNVIKYINYAGQTTEYKYNDDNLVTGITTPSEGISYTYDAVGRRTSMVDAHGETQYKYNPLDGSLQTLHYPDGAEIGYTYNKQARTGYKFTSGTGEAIQIQGKLDEMNRLTEMNISSGTAGGISTFAGASSQQMTFEYEANSLLKRQASSNNVSTTFSYNGYDLSGVNIGGGSSSQQFTYDYDNNKNIINRTQNGTTDQFTYDSLSRIESEQSDGKDKTFTYDDQGNRLTIAGGQISGLKNRKYTFDTLDRLIGVTGQGQGKETIDVTYSYNGDGLLYERVTKDQRIRYYYDEEGKLLAEATIGADNAPRVSYFYIYDLDGRLWARQSKTNGMEYYQFNGHGDVVGLTDSTGNELNSYSYDIWGNPTNEKEDVPNVFRYSSEYWDSDTGLQYLRARWYDPNTARFVSRDTYEGELTNPLSLNLYSYVENNPLTNVDPSGHTLSCAFLCFAAGTVIETLDGPKAVEDIQVNDRVLTKDEESGELSYQPVEETFNRITNETYHIHVNETEIVTTAEHPFWVAGIGWIESRGLQVGDNLIDDEGKEYKIDRIEIKDEETTVYNFRVHKNHNYFVTNLKIWTHNCGYNNIGGRVTSGQSIGRSGMGSSVKSSTKASVGKSTSIKPGTTIKASNGLNTTMSQQMFVKKASFNTRSINPNEIRFSQSSVNGAKEITDSMKANGWKGAPIDVIKMSDGKLTTVDNTRVLAARNAGINVKANVHNANDPIPTDMAQRFVSRNGAVPKTWGEAVTNRINNQNSSYRSTNPNGSNIIGWDGR